MDVRSNSRKLRSSSDKKNKMDTEIFEDSSVAEVSQQLASASCTEQSFEYLSEMEQQMELDEVATTDEMRPGKRRLSEVLDCEKTEERVNAKYLKTATGDRKSVVENDADLNLDIAGSLKNCDISHKSPTPVFDENTMRILACVDQFMNLKGCDNDAVEKQPPGQKWLIFDIQAQVVEMYDAFVLQAELKNENYADFLLPLIKKLTVLLDSWKSLLFEKSALGEFAITKEMDDQNVKSLEIFSHLEKKENILNVNFLVFMDKHLPLMEILYILRLAGCLCLYNFSLCSLFNEGVDDEF